MKKKMVKLKGNGKNDHNDATASERKMNNLKIIFEYENDFIL